MNLTEQDLNPKDLSSKVVEMSIENNMAEIQKGIQSTFKDLKASLETVAKANPKKDNEKLVQTQFKQLDSIGVVNAVLVLTNEEKNFLSDDATIK